MANQHSKIVTYILEHPLTWEIDFDTLGIHISKNGDLALFKYGIECDFSNPLVQEARGIIINLSDYSVVCWPFRKFGNYGESYADNIDWDSARVQEKVDGSIVKLYWFDNEWRWATNGTILAQDAYVPLTNNGVSFLTLIQSAVNYNELQFNDFNKNYTYIFELVSPLNRIVVEYNKTMLYHLGTRDNITGAEMNIDIGIQKPKNYPISSLEDCLNAVNQLCDEDHILEGFVVVDKNWNRVKIKTPEYLTQHHLWNNNHYIIPKEDAILAVLNDNWNEHASHAHLSQYHWYKYQLEVLKWQIDRFLIMTRGLYAEYSYERKPVANKIKDHRLAWFGFKGLGNKMTSDELIAQASISKIVSLLPDYPLPEFLEKGLEVI